MKMRVSVKRGTVLQKNVDAILVGIHENGTGFSPLAQEINRLLGRAISKVLERKGFTGKPEQIEVIGTGGEIPAAYVFLCGLGKAEKAGLEQVRQAMGRASLRAREMGLKTLATSAGTFGFRLEGVPIKDVGYAMAEGAILGLYRFSKYKVKEDTNSRNIEELRVIEEESDDVRKAKEGVIHGRIVAESVNFAKDLINHPANDMTPAILAETAKKMAAANKIKCTVLSRPQIGRLGMGGVF